MTIKERKELEERLNDKIAKGEELLQRAVTEKRELTDDEKEEIAEIRDNVRDIKAMLEAERELADSRVDSSASTDATPSDERACDDEEADRRAFDAYIRGTVLNIRGTETELDKDSNGAVIPQTIARKIIAKVYDICPILERSSKYNVKGKLIIPTYDEGGDNDGITVTYASEFAELESHVGKFGKIELEGFLAGALALISLSLVNNSDFNLVDFVIERMALAISRFIEDQLLNGYVPTGADDGVVGLTGATNTITAAATNAITANEVIALHDSIKDVFQNDAIFIMSSATRTALRCLKTTTGEYLLNDDISTPFGTSILGKPVYVSDNMPDIAAGATAIYYGDMSGLATKFSEDMNIQAIREKYLTQHALGIVGWLEFDAAVENQQKIAALVMHSA